MIKLIKQLYEKSLFRKKNVFGVAVGIKFTKGKLTKSKCIQVIVPKKQSNLNKKDLVPKRILGFKTDVLEVGDLKFLNEWRKVHRPVRMGGSCCWEGLTACSSGLPVWDNEGEMYIMMNCHCIKPFGSKEGDQVLSPGPADGGVKDRDKVGEVTDLNFPVNHENEDNIDVSFFKATTDFIKEDVEGNNYIPETRMFNVGDLGKDIFGGGRTIGETRTGLIASVNLTAKVYGRGGVVNQFKDCVLALNVEKNGNKPIVMGGDSSSIRNVEGKPMAQCFAGSEVAAVFNQTQKSLDWAKQQGKEFYLEKPRPKEGYIAAQGKWSDGKKTTVNLNFRETPGGNWISMLKKGTKIKLLKEKPIWKHGYYWIKIQVGG